MWSYEQGGAYGWEAIGTLFLKDGHITGGGRNRYSTGTYKTKGEGAVLHIEINQLGKKRALFGQKRKQVCVVVKARRDKDKMMGEATLPGALFGHTNYGICIRFKRRADLPKEKNL